MKKPEFKIKIPTKKINEFCIRNHITRLSLFGSVLRGDFRPESDVDVLVEFERDHIPGLDFFGMETELSDILKRKVDFNTPNFISPYFRMEVKEQARPLYVKTSSKSHQPA